MLQFHFGQTANCFLTLQEQVTLDTPFFLFVFESRAGETVAAVIERASTTWRADEFNIDVDTLFEDKTTGQWAYSVYEQDNPENTDPDDATSLLEVGIMQLHPSAAFEFTERSTTTTFIQRQ